MNIREKFQSELKTQMKAKSSEVPTIRLILAALKDRDIAIRQKGTSDGILDDQILLMLQSMIKQRKESIKAYKAAGRNDLADNEANEITTIEKFLPKSMDENEITQIIKDAIQEFSAQSLKDIGKVMQSLRARYPGQMDFATAADILKKELGQ